ncbi:MAG: hypothetical protein KDA20_05355 [Phycisphaerales bacterium]|nr:hypothetical protein [Phycisphaerales bacterium]
MNCAPLTTRRGMALLLALLALSILSLTGVGLLRAASTSRLASTTDTTDAADRAIVRDLSHMILARLREQAGPVADPDWLQPGSLTWLEQRLDAKTLVRVQALDLCGRLRVDQLDTFAASGLPAAVRRALRTDDIELTSGTRPLLEAMLTEQPPDDRATDPWRWVTTHGSGAISLHTAPLPLLRGALIGLEPTATTQVLAARTAETPIPADLAQRLIAERRQQRRAGGNNDRFVALTDRSEAIGITITIARAGLSPRTWWLVASLEPATQRSGPGWRIVEQRRVVLDAP